MSYGPAAARLGISLDEYEARKAANQKWCTRCKAWHLLTAFPPDRSRRDSLSASCNPRTPAEAQAAPPIPVIERSAVDLAYLAGVIDADGYIGAQVNRRKRYVGATVGITGARREPHDLAAGLFGGNVSVYHHRGEREGYRPQHAWQRAGRQAVPVIAAVMPYLRVKFDQADLALQLQEMVEERRLEEQSEDPYPYFGPDFDSFEHVAWFAVSNVQALNLRGNRAGHRQHSRESLSPNGAPS